MSRRRALLVVPLVGLLAACGLPVEPGVRSAGPVGAGEVDPGVVQFYPPGPQPDAGPRELVLGFLSAQASADDDHALAREFLAPELREEWDDDAGAVVYEANNDLEVLVDDGDESRVVVRADTVATIGADGGYQLQDGSTEDVYRLRRDDQGRLRLVEVPSGLRLTPLGAARSFRPRSVFFLGTADGPRPPGQLVPDRVFLPVADEPDALVRHLVAGPSSALRGAVTTALPPGTGLRRPVSFTDGVATVDLTGPVRETGDEQRRQLSAQLVWTLLEANPAASAVRVLVDGEPLPVPGAEERQERSDWSAFDPTGPAGRAPALFVADRRLQRLDGAPPGSEATDGRLPVDAVAVAPRSGALALLTRDGAADGGDVVRTGPAAGSFEPALTVPEVASLSWGSGDRGLWVLTGDARVLLVPPDREPVEVPYVRPAGAGPLSALRVSRDGARVAAVFGTGTDRRVHVGRVEPGEDGPRVAALRAVAPGLADVADVAWASGTSLVVLAPLGTPNRLPVRVAVDGSEVEPVRTLGVVGEPQTVAAAPDRPLVVGSVLDGRPVLLVEDGGLFRLQPGSGSEPTYPG